jgi:hypothetical protein
VTQSAVSKAEWRFFTGHTTILATAVAKLRIGATPRLELQDGP